MTTELDPLIEMDVRWSLVHSLRAALGLAEAMMVLSSTEITDTQGMDQVIAGQRRAIAGIARKLCAAQLLNHQEKVNTAFDNWRRSI